MYLAPDAGGDPNGILPRSLVPEIWSLSYPKVVFYIYHFSGTIPNCDGWTDKQTHNHCTCHASTESS